MNPPTPPPSPTRSTKPSSNPPHPRRPPTPPPAARPQFSRTCHYCNKQPARSECHNNKNGNAGRFYFFCSECNRFVGWDDTVGIFAENPLCDCEPRWRSRKVRRFDGSMALSCANPGGLCGFWVVRVCTVEDRAAIEKQTRELLEGGSWGVEGKKQEEESKEESEVWEFECDMCGFENNPWCGCNEGGRSEEDGSYEDRDPYEGIRQKINRWQRLQGFMLGV